MSSTPLSDQKSVHSFREAAFLPLVSIERTLATGSLATAPVSTDCGAVPAEVDHHHPALPSSEALRPKVHA